MNIEKMIRTEFNEKYHYEVSSDKNKCCRVCMDFRRHPSGVTFCHFLFQVLIDKHESVVWGKYICDRFSALPIVEEK